MNVYCSRKTNQQTDQEELQNEFDRLRLSAKYSAG